ncbi:DUF317 domain-containing protein [Streptomyces sp. NPDC002082]|uniref:DUF317 domain-containing protein n=1 Tax=Streptomyces sp. NPDC002082 TaxID=3154772 RepID=UPI00332F8B62
MTVEVGRHGFSTSIEALRIRTWMLGRGQPSQVIDQFTAEDFHFVVDDRADMHIASKDGRLYLGWFPEGRPGRLDEGWRLAVTGTATLPGYSIGFDVETPAHVIASAVATVISTSGPA